MYRLKEIESELDFELQSKDMDLTESRFINEPFYKIEKSLILFDFFPIQNSTLSSVGKIFITGYSKILMPEHFIPELLLVMPPKIRKAELIYQYSAE